MTDTGVEYELKTVTAVRGTEARSRTKWEQQGWELVSQEELPMLRTKLTFRRAKPKFPWITLAIVGGVLAVLAVIVLVMNLITGSADASGNAAPSTPVDTPSAAPTEEPTATEYTYAGPVYEIVSIDEELTDATLTQYWIFCDELGIASEAYRDQVKAIITDVAHEQGTALFLAEIVQNREIALAESFSSHDAFVAEYGEDYAVNTIPQLEPDGWVASYTGGYDYDNGTPDDSAFEIVWWPAGDPEFEAWGPELGD